MAKGVHHKDKVTIRKGGRKPKVDLSNTYGIKAGSKSTTKRSGAVTTTKRGKKVTRSSGLGKIKGGK